MKVLMFGWEYPPHVFGGLATANYGISEGLKAQGDIEIALCLPHPFGDEEQHAARIIAMNAVPSAWRDVNRDYVQSRVGNIMNPDYYYKLRENIYADFNYMNVNDLGCMHMDTQRLTAYILRMDSSRTCQPVVGMNDIEVLSACHHTCYHRVVVDLLVQV